MTLFALEKFPDSDVGECLEDLDAERFAPLPVSKIRDWLCQHRQGFKGRPPTYKVPIAPLARFIGVHPDVLHRAARGDVSKGNLGERTRLRLSIMIRRLEAGELRFVREGQGWATVQRLLEADGLAREPCQVSEAHHHEWARCERCGGIDWMPVWLGGSPGTGPGYCCKRCVPEDQIPFLPIWRRGITTKEN